MNSKTRRRRHSDILSPRLVPRGVSPKTHASDDNDINKPIDSVYKPIPTESPFSTVSSELLSIEIPTVDLEYPCSTNYSALPSVKSFHQAQKITQQPTNTSTQTLMSQSRKLLSSISAEELIQKPKHPKTKAATLRSSSLNEVRKPERKDTKNEIISLPPSGADPLWYFGNVTRQETETIFTNLNKNILIVRNSSTRPGCWVLSLGYIQQKPAHIIISTKIVEGQVKWYLEDCIDTNTYDSIMELLVQSPECDTHAFAGSVVENTWFTFKPLTPIPKPNRHTMRSSSSPKLTKSEPTNVFLALESSPS